MRKSNLRGERVLLTGGGGFIGSHLAERLLNEGARLRIFLRYNSRADEGCLRFLPSELKDKAKIIFGDLRELESVKSAMKDCRVVFHLGALPGIPYSYVHPLEVIDTNTMGTVNVLLAARELGVSRVVHTSTSEVYGTAREVPMDEQHPLQAQSPYAASKIAADAIAVSFAKSFGLGVVIVRPFNTYGPRQSDRAIIPTIIAQALTQEAIHLGDLRPKRDLTYVEDIVQGFFLAATQPKAQGLALNLGSGRAISVFELARKVTQIVGRKIPILSEKKRRRPKESEVLLLRADSRRARKILGWRPRVNLEEGLTKTLQWITERPEMYFPKTYRT